MLEINHSYVLSTENGRNLGQLQLESMTEKVCCGTFVEGPDFDSVRELFRELDDVVNNQLLANVDQVTDRIASLHPKLFLSGTSIPIYDLQIYNDGGVSFRMQPERA